MKLEKDKVLTCLTEADRKWFHSHSSEFNYAAHLEFVASYVARNYDKEPKKGTRLRKAAADGSDE